MPTYEYACEECEHHFDVLVLKKSEDEITCPECGSDELERVFTAPSVKTSTTHGKAMRAAKRRDRRQAEVNIRKQQEYAEAHDDH